MVDQELWTSQQVADYLGVTINNLRQLQFRKTIVWAKKVGKAVFYVPDEIIAYKVKRDSRIK